MPLELQDNHSIEVVLVIFYKKNHLGSNLFFLQQRLNKKNQILWEFPGGKVEVAETQLAAVYREVEEELNINLCNVDEKKIKFFEDFYYEYPTYKVHLNCYLIQHDFNAAGNSNWYLINDLCCSDFPLIEGSRQILESIKKYFNA